MLLCLTQLECLRIALRRSQPYAPAHLYASLRDNGHVRLHAPAWVKLLRLHGIRADDLDGRLLASRVSSKDDGVSLADFLRWTRPTSGGIHSNCGANACQVALAQESSDVLIAHMGLLEVEAAADLAVAAAAARTTCRGHCIPCFLFGCMDTSKKGFVTEADLARSMGLLQQPSFDAVAGVFRRLDRSNRGTVSAADWAVEFLHTEVACRCTGAPQLTFAKRSEPAINTISSEFQALLKSALTCATHDNLRGSPNGEPKQQACPASVCQARTLRYPSRKEAASAAIPSTVLPAPRRDYPEQAYPHNCSRRLRTLSTPQEKNTPEVFGPSGLRECLQHVSCLPGQSPECGSAASSLKQPVRVRGAGQVPEWAQMGTGESLISADVSEGKCSSKREFDPVSDSQRGLALKPGARSCGGSPVCNILTTLGICTGPLKNPPAVALARSSEVSHTLDRQIRAAALGEHHTNEMNLFQDPSASKSDQMWSSARKNYPAAPPSVTRDTSFQAAPSAAQGNPVWQPAAAAAEEVKDSEHRGKQMDAPGENLIEQQKQFQKQLFQQVQSQLEIQLHQQLQQQLQSQLRHLHAQLKPAVHQSASLLSDEGAYGFVVEHLKPHQVVYNISLPMRTQLQRPLEKTSTRPAPQYRIKSAFGERARRTGSSVIRYRGLERSRSGPLPGPAQNTVRFASAPPLPVFTACVRQQKLLDSRLGEAAEEKERQLHAILKELTIRQDFSLVDVWRVFDPEGAGVSEVKGVQDGMSRLGIRCSPQEAKNFIWYYCPADQSGLTFPAFAGLFAVGGEEQLHLLLCVEHQNPCTVPAAYLALSAKTRRLLATFLRLALDKATPPLERLRRTKICIDWGAAGPSRRNTGIGHNAFVRRWLIPFGRLRLHWFAGFRP
ncbi:hypothetical protein Efla_002892 [Eimeria flavescens]